MWSVLIASDTVSDFAALSLITVCFREFGAEQKDLDRVIDPYKDDDQRAAPYVDAMAACYVVLMH
jgi:hypothetical protein